MTRGKSRMRSSRLYGSVRGAAGNSRPYRDRFLAWPPFMEILLNRIIEAGYIEVRIGQAVSTVAGMRINPDFLTLTEKGKQSLYDLGVKDFNFCTFRDLPA
jgi:hypothetical protein